jgi:arsenite-transporting ATPase
VPLFQAPLLPSEPIGVPALRGLARSLYGERDPAARFAQGRPIRLEKRVARTCLEIDLPSASRDEIEVTAHGDELLVRVRDAQRLIALPARGRAGGGRGARRGARSSSRWPAASAARGRWCRARRRR